MTEYSFRKEGVSKSKSNQMLHKFTIYVETDDNDFLSYLDKKIDEIIEEY